jgi:hypothetical protein
MAAKQIQALATILWEQIEGDEALAQKVEEALGDFAVQFAKHRAIKKSAEAVNLSKIQAPEGVEGLKKDLSRLTLDGLKFLVSSRGLDPTGETKGAKKPQLIEFVIAKAKSRAAREGVFNY